MATKRNRNPKRKKKSELEQLVEAQAQGQHAKLEDVSTEEAAPQDSELENRKSKDSGYYFDLD